MDEISYYAAGYAEATRQLQENLAATLRVFAIPLDDAIFDDTQVLTQRTVREIFSTVHGEMAAVAEFGAGVVIADDV